MPVQSVHRAIDILSLFSISRPRLGVTEISELLGLSKPTVHGLVRTLAERGFLQQDVETRKYMLGLKIYELGAILSGTLKINQIGAGTVHKLAKDTRCTARIAIRDQDSVLVTLTLYPHLQQVIFQPLGPRIPMYCSSIGKAILSALPEKELSAYLDRTALSSFTPHTVIDKGRLREELKTARELGYAVDRQEYLIGLACVGAPVFDALGNPFASVSLSGPPERFIASKIKDFGKKAMRTTAEISRLLGFMPSPDRARPSF
ncbi:MAG: IclR family transcriptional regulator [Desulfobacterales bacterium]|jgi:IclR family KDG regulon transcriptional repressor